MVRWTPYLGLLVNDVWFFQALYCGLGLLAAEPFEAANRSYKAIQQRGVPKGGPTATHSSAIKMAARALATDSQVQQQLGSLQRPRRAYTSRKSSTGSAQRSG